MKIKRPMSYTNTPGEYFPRFSGGREGDLILVYDLETTSGVDVVMKPYLITFTIFRVKDHKFMEDAINKETGEISNAFVQDKVVACFKQAGINKDPLDEFVEFLE